MEMNDPIYDAARENSRLESENKSLRARVAELERREVAHASKLFDAEGARDRAAQRAATLQAEVERLKSSLDAADRRGDVEVKRAIRAEEALAESERKRAILVKALDEESWRLIELNEAE